MRAGEVSPFSLDSPQLAGVIVGKTIDGSSNTPVAGAQVAIVGRADRVLTNADGSFVFFDLLDGTYDLVAMKEGYAPGAPGQRWTATTQPLEQPGRTRSPHSTTIVVRAGRPTTEAEVRLWRYGSIGGRVVDEYGEPIVGLQVQGWPERSHAGRRHFDGDLPATARTDDRGIYRLPQLLPGNYVVAVSATSITVPSSFESPAGRWDTPWSIDLYRSLRAHDAAFPDAASSFRTHKSERLHAEAGPAPPVAPGVGYATTFHPGAMSLSGAAIVPVSAAQAVEAIDLALRPVSTVTVAGAARGIDARPASATALRLVRTDPGDRENDMEVAVALTDASGRFVFDRVPAGHYEIRAWNVPTTGRPQAFVPRGSSVPMLSFRTLPWSDESSPWASHPIDVGDRDVPDVVVHLRSGYRLQGTLAFPTSARPSADALRAVRLSLDRPDGRLRTARASNEIELNEALRFRSIELPPGPYLVRIAGLPAGWVLESAMLDGRDVSLEPIELHGAPAADIVITLTDRATPVSGTVRRDPAMGSLEPAVVIFPSDRRRWRDYGAEPRDIAFAQVDETGRYVFAHMPAGDYYVAAVDTRALALWNSEALFDRLSTVAVHRRIVAGTTNSVDLIARPLP